MKKSCACWNGCTWTRRICLPLSSTDYLSRGKPPSAARRWMIDPAGIGGPDDDPLYVVAIGAITNVAAACCSNRIWSARSWWYGWWEHAPPSTMEFNLMQDPDTRPRSFFNNVPFVQIPCLGVASHLLTTQRAG